MKEQMQARQVLEFTLNEEQYCLDIEYIREIVLCSGDYVQPRPDSPPHVEGVINLRGEPTTVIDVGDVLSLEKGDATSRDKVIVFNDEAPADQNIGWMVDEVERVSTIDIEDLEQKDNETLKGIINRDEGCIRWTNPEMVATPA